MQIKQTQEGQIVGLVSVKFIIEPQELVLLCADLLQRRETLTKKLVLARLEFCLRSKGSHYIDGQIDMINEDIHRYNKQNPGYLCPYLEDALAFVRKMFPTANFSAIEQLIARYKAVVKRGYGGNF